MRARPDPPGGPYLVVGLARSGVAAALALRDRDEQVIGVDAGRPNGLASLSTAGVEVHTQACGVELLERVRTLVKSPGVPAQAPVVAEARARGLCVIGELELAWRMLPNELIALTGTNGKTTTVELLGHIYRGAGLEVAVAGNVGAALSGCVGTIPTHATVVCEASSFQLEDTLAFAPEMAVLLNLTPDHLDRHGTFEAYKQAKLRLFANQQPTDVAVIPQGLDARLPGRARQVRFGTAPGAQLECREGTLYWQGDRLLDRDELTLPGRHNLENAMAAAAAALARGIDAEMVCEGLRTFPGVSHRLERVATRQGVLYVNDSKATNVASTIVALEAMLEEGRPARLILGGQGKGQDFSALREPLRRACRAAYLIGEDAEAIERAIASDGASLRRCGDLEHAIAAAAADAASGEAVLLSPGCASFDQFANYEQRGERFRALVEAL